MKLTILGCSGSMSGPASPASSYLLQANGRDADGIVREYSVVLDLGSGAMGQLIAHLDPAAVDAVALSHLHADHCVDIVGMHVYRKWHPSGPLRSIPVYSPGDGEQRTRAIDGGGPEDDYSTFDFHEIAPGSEFSVGPMRFEVFEATHTVPAVSFRITGPSEFTSQKQVVFTFSGDTDYCESVVEAARDADLFLCEAALEDKRDTFRGVHMNGERAGKLAAEAGAKRVLLTHLQPWTDRRIVMAHAAESYDGELACVKAGEVYTV